MIEDSDNDISCDDQNEMLNVLGVSWNSISDTLCFKMCLDEVLENNTRAKRFVLHMIASIYNPLGILAPVSVVFKIFFQTVCTNNQPWDKPLDDNSKHACFFMLRSVSLVRTETSRYYFGIKPNMSINFGILNMKSINLYGFRDASKPAYSAIIYIINSKIEPTVGHIVACKTKVPC